MNMTPILGRDELATAAPAIFAEHRHRRTSERYSFFPTSSVITALDGEGWVPTVARSARCKDVGRRGFEKHMVRFTHRDHLSRMERPELIIINSHDLTCGFQTHAGYFRFFCLNGLVIADTVFGYSSTRHSHVTLDQIRERSAQITANAAAIDARIESYKSIHLTPEQRTLFANAAIIARHGEGSVYTAEQFLEPRRESDKGLDLWTTFNVVQEHALRGGDAGKVIRYNGRTRQMRSRSVKAIDSSIDLNKGLWSLADQLATTGTISLN